MWAGGELPVLAEAVLSGEVVCVGRWYVWGGGMYGEVVCVGRWYVRCGYVVTLYVVCGDILRLPLLLWLPSALM